MKFITSREIRSNPARLWEVRENDETVITVNGKPLALVVPVGDDLEAALASGRRARTTAALEQVRMHARKKGLDTLSSDEIDKEIRKVRAGR
jgi:antitoxin (DNA-binding transcriptional repressor) of toxin-antitoxin stability system